jgi:hypothetical protein
MIAPYSYQPLDTSRQQIRLLKVVPAHSGQIDGHLRIFNFEDVPLFTALSYTWGPKGDEKSILIDGGSMLVRHNLYDFLEGFRSKENLTWIWIDQICINQDATKERNHQVQLMEQVYHGAEEVLIWLGRDEDDGTAFKPIETVEIGGQRQWSLQSDQALQKALNVPYWERHWIIQEIVLARTRHLCTAIRLFPGISGGT